MQDSRDNDKKSDRQLAIFDFIYAKFVTGYPCVILHILFYMHGPAFLLCFWVT